MRSLGSRREAPELPGDDQRLMRIQIETLFTHDGSGKMVRVNEPGGQRAPRFFLGRTAHGNEWRFRDDLDDRLIDELTRACAREPASSGLSDAPDQTAGFEEILARSAPIQRTWSGPAYRFPNELPVAPDVIAVTSANADLLHRHLIEWEDEVGIRQPMFARIVDGYAVSLCCSVRIGADAHEAGVETADAFRGRGYAAQVVAGWARAVRGLGRIPLYSTSWPNAASQALAGTLGLIRFGTDLHIT